MGSPGASFCSMPMTDKGEMSCNVGQRQDACRPLCGCMQAAKQALKRQLYLRALLIALRLKDTSLQREVVLATPASEVSTPSWWQTSCL